MEDAADTVVPLRPGFDVQVRGFRREQVIDHIEVLEDQLKIVSIDRNEAIQLNSDLRRLCDDLRHDLSEAEQRLHRIESSDTGLPAASQRVQNMLAIAEDEVQTLREQARSQAEVLRGTAETEAREVLDEAEEAAKQLQADSAEILAEVERRLQELRSEHKRNINDLRDQEQRMRHAICDEYKTAMATAQAEADELLAQTRDQCARWDAESEKMRLDALEEIQHQRSQHDAYRVAVLSALEGARSSIDNSMGGLQMESEPAEERGADQVRVPDQRDDANSFTVAVDSQMLETNVSPPDFSQPDMENSDPSHRN